jgi:hypothetical protein
MTDKSTCEQLARSMHLIVQELQPGVVWMIADLKKFKNKFKKDWHEFHKAGNMNFGWAETYEELLELKEKITQIKKEKPMEQIVEVKVETTSKEERGRKSAYRGKTLIAKTKENKRRKGSAGQVSLQIIIDNSPIVYEAFLTAGGRRQDLAFDIKENRVLALGYDGEVEES